ncbi:MAG: asparagine synthase (glutamine-hydrolyzing) [Saprospiraceae bacterium]|nr:asparagine synthase (glutamine-hydrolyzing) [Saprospiraceae bacterium]
MCGICGILAFDKNRRVTQEEMVDMSVETIHRGPDDDGTYISGHVGLGFRRLSIIDLSGGHQPLSNEDGTIWIVFNGEVYNFRTLRKELEQKGHIFKSNTDTETIIHLYEEMGTQCVSRLRGMFALAIWDEKKQVLFCARDRFGIKPFFYRQDDQRFFFGSEIKNILKVSERPSMATDVLDYYLTYGYTPSDRTIYQQINKLPPAHTLVIREGKKPLISRYWDIRFEPNHTLSVQDWQEVLREKLREAIRMRLVSDVPLGAFLSGGIDSGSVVALMAQESTRPVKTFSIGFAEKQFNELPLARLTAEKYRTEHHEHIVEPQSIDILSTLVRCYDEPFGDSSAIPTYFVSEFARSHVTVALSGDGGDELFAGYDHYKKLKKIESFHRFTGGLGVWPAGLLHQLIPRKIKGSGLSYYLSRPRSSFPAYYGKWQETERAGMYRPDVWEKLTQQKGEKVKQAVLANSATEDFVSRLQELDMRTWMVDDILTKVDRASMIHSLEVRVPILDHEFAELTFTIPSALKLNGNQGKYIFKEAMKPLLPQSILTQQKKGFGVPLKHWFKHDLKPYLQDTLLSNNSPLHTYLEPAAIKKLIKDHATGMRDLNQKIWTLVFLHAWLEDQQYSSTEHSTYHGGKQ